jgi:hypothetical protein
MFSSTTYGLFETPIITNAGMITGMGIDGTYVMRSNPVINMADFFRPRYDTPKYETRCIGDVMDAAEKARERAYEYNKSTKEFQLNELKAQNAMREENEKKLAMERALRDAAEKALALEREQKLIEERTKREAAEKALAEERAKKLEEEQKAHKLTAKSLSEYDKLMRKIAMKNLSISSNTSTVSSSKISSVKSSGMSTISSATSVSKMSAIGSVVSDCVGLYDGDDDETDITFSDSASNTGSDSESEPGSDTDTETSVSSPTIIHKTIDPNEKSRFSNCTRCAKCFNGVSSVGCIIVAKIDDDHKFFLGNNIAENAYCDYSQKLKSIGKRCELPSERAEKIIKRMTDIDFDIDQHDFIDIPIKDNLHVHRVYIIHYNSFKTKITINVTTEYNSVAMFSMNNIRDNIDLYNNKQIFDSKNNLCNINKRIQKVLEIYYNYFC